MITFSEVQVAEAYEVLASKISMIFAFAVATRASRLLFVEAETVPKMPKAMA